MSQQIEGPQQALMEHQGKIKKKKSPKPYLCM
jgi:hypothetical protein